jgi:hypothetical protein
VAELTVKRFLCCGFRRGGISASMLAEDMSRNKCFPDSNITFLGFVTICDLFTDCPSYYYYIIRNS